MNFINTIKTIAVYHMPISAALCISIGLTGYFSAKSDTWVKMPLKQMRAEFEGYEEKRAEYDKKCREEYDREYNNGVIDGENDYREGRTFEQRMEVNKRKYENIPYAPMVHPVLKYNGNWL